jgi:transposase-like protein
MGGEHWLLRFREGARRLARRYRGQRYPEALRRLAVGHAVRRQAKGATIAIAARELGVHVVTLTNWLRQSRRRVEAVPVPDPKLLPVRVAAETVEARFPSGDRCEQGKLGDHSGWPRGGSACQDHPIAVVQARASGLVSPPCTVLGPCGLRIEGLSIRELAELLRWLS